MAKSALRTAEAPAPTPVPPPPLFPAGYKTPISLLSERCQKEGWDKPHIDTKQLSGTGWTAYVVLRRTNAKKVREAVTMRPPAAPSPIAVEKTSAMEAKHWAALYALYRFSNNLRLNLQLPPSTREYWAALEAEKAASTPNKTWLWSTTPFETAAAAPKPPSHVASSSVSMSSSFDSPVASPFSSVPVSAATSRSSTPNPRSASLAARWSAAPEVRMPAALRDLVEETIRSMTIRYPPPAVDPDDEDAYVPPSPEDISITMELTRAGWRPGHIRNALHHVNSSRLSGVDLQSTLIAAVEQHLHLNVTEEDLPGVFRSSKPADATARIATVNGTEELGMAWAARTLSEQSGFPIAPVEKVMRDANGDEGVAVDLLVRRLVGYEGELSEESLFAQVQAPVEVDSELEERRKDEMLGLEGIFGPRFRTTETGLEILISSTARRTQNSTADQVVLRVLLHPHSQYPSPSEEGAFPHLPSFYVFSSTLPTYIRLHLTALIAAQFASPDHEDWMDLVRGGYGGVIGEIASYLTDVWEREVANPPEAREVLAKLLGSRLQAPVVVASSAAAKKGTNARRKAYRAPPTPQAHALLTQALENNSRRPGYAAMLKVRSNLPAWSMQDEIVGLIRDNRVVIVSGETGSGKTTQVPSFVLDDAIRSGRGASTNIIVTQPRRVSAIGVATRVAAERLEDINDPNSRQLVGYAIRGERKAGPNTRLLFCTTGVILSRLSRGSDADLEDVSHIFIDEVHERSLDSDFLLLELLSVLQRNKNIKVILMSATINQEQFSKYFGGAPCVSIAGFAHPVTDHYLEDILPHLSYQPPSSIKPAKKATIEQLAQMRQSFVERGVENERTLNSLEVLTRSSRIEYGLVGAVTAHCLTQTGEGDVLVFMSGVGEIRQAIDAIRAAVPSSIKMDIFPLHANLSSQEQASVFRPTKPGFRKVVVATNVAETSITIDGITSVIDAGRVKENTFDPETTIVKLEEQWTSRASAKQRRGRAGRTRPGDCFKLFTHWTEEHNMLPHPIPEMVRIPLEMLLLQIKSIRADADVKVFLARALSPPNVLAIDSAVATLRLLGAMEEGGGDAAKLTPLGMHLSRIPVDLRLGKMLVLAAVFSCLDPILTVASLLSSKPFFLTPMDRRDEAKKARSMFYTSRSDLLSDVKAFDACLIARSQGSSSLKSFAEENFISLSTFRDVLTLRSEYLNALVDVGFVPFRASPTLPALNHNALNENLLKAIIYAGTGRIVKVKLPPAVFDKGLSGTIARDRLSKEVKFYEPGPDGRVFLHPGSLLFSETRFATPFITYFSKHVTTKPFLRDSTEIPLYGILLFGGRIRIDLQRGLTVGNGDASQLMRSWPRIGVLVLELRRLFDAELEANFDEPNFHSHTSLVVQAMLALLEKDGGLY